MHLPKLKMSREQFYEIQYLTNKCDKEISGMGTIIIDKDHNFVVEKLFLLNQECSGAATDLDAAAVNKCLYDTRECQGTLSFWWHSHVNMGAFFSGQDKTTIQEHGSNGFMLGLVINKRGEYKIALGTSKPRIYTETGIDLLITENIDASLTERLDREYLEKVRFTSYANNAGLSPRSRYYGYEDDYMNYGEDIPQPMIYSDKGKWIDNPEYIAYKARQTKLRNAEDKKTQENDKLARGNLQQRSEQELKEAVEYDEKTQKIGEEFDALDDSKRLKIFAMYEQWFCDKATDIDDLREFYISHVMSIGDIKW